MWMLILIILWLILFLWLDRGIVNEHLGPASQPTPQASDEAVDVVIAFRNEANNLPKLLKDLIRSVHEERCLHIILIDDHSTDAGQQTIDQAMKAAPRNVTYTSVVSEGAGKKAALKTGLKASKAPWIFFTDADCRLPSLHIERMIALAGKEERRVVFAPVWINSDQWFGKLQVLENLNTQAITESFLSRGRPLMVNGANMLLPAVKKDIYLKSQHWGYPGGDDVFFAQSLERDDYAFHYDRSYAIKTGAMKTWPELIQQRVRWVSKSRSYVNGLHLLFTGLYAVLSLGFIVSWGLALSANSLWNTAWFVLIAKWMIERGFHAKWSIKYMDKLPWGLHALLSLGYPFYSLFIGVLSLLPMRFNWKGRSYSTKPTASATV
jgi:glycosyltransferase involved in cell wall biosynthesis